MGKQFWGKSPVDCVKKIAKIALSCTVSEINALLRFFAEILDGCQKWWKNDFGEK